MNSSSEELKVQAINIDEISDIGAILPNGRYVAKLTAVNPKEGIDGGAGTVEAVWEVLEGEHEGTDIRIWYGLKITKNTKGDKVRYYAPGISQMKAEFNNVGSPLPPGFPFPTDVTAAARLYAQHMIVTKVPRAHIALIEDSYEDKETHEKKIVQRKRVLGLATPGTSGSGAAAPKVTDPVAPAATGGNVLNALNLS